MFEVQWNGDKKIQRYNEAGRFDSQTTNETTCDQALPQRVLFVVRPGLFLFLNVLLNVVFVCMMVREGGW